LLGVKDERENGQQKKRYRTHAAVIIAKRMRAALHIMLIDVKQPLKPGDKVPLTLTVQRADFSGRSVFTVQAEVRAAAAENAHRH
jgi:3-hydroxymyristoyl/3-hydroxydecanoyl-(acyl carrier protein) dehydratase